ncbi:NADPH-dependent FMN reductase [Aureimonas altamirensis]|uniref:NADPH-dependent FMN reductase n=1 Tax=Aureimonas altamirensis TaxID=370622 RepID=UPI00255644E2|nr:NAD(P)H-dependent oxidoreductase [Aureimonas altamirensis]
MKHKLKLAVLYGSTREGRFCDKVAAWLLELLRPNTAFEIDVIDPLKLELPPHHELQDSPPVQKYLARLARADGFIVVTPEYNHGYPAALKFLIDTAQSEWRAKPVGFVSYGGLAGGLRAVEQLRLVFAELHAVGLRDTVSFASPWETLDEAGRLQGSASSERALTAMMQQLEWWGNALRDARNSEPWKMAS